MTSLEAIDRYALLETEIDFSNRVRKQTRSLNVLYHGTRYGRKILKAGELRYSDVGDNVVCFTRSPEIAVFWAMLPRDDDEGRGCVIAVDQVSLKRCYRLEPHRDGFWDHQGYPNDEMEERIWGRDVADLDRHLVTAIWSEAD